MIGWAPAFLLFSFLSMAAQAQTGSCDPQRDSLALVELYESTGGVNWKQQTNWLQPGAPIGQWYGVTTAGDGCVTALVLDTNQLQGTLPMALSDLRRLEVLRLRGNGLSGPLPPELTHLPDLDTLNLSENTFTGPFPANPNTNLPLRMLDISSNTFSDTFPATINKFPALEFLDISSNEFSHVPEAIFDLLELRVLNVSFLGFDPLTNNIKQLTKLEVLASSGNYNSYIRDSIIHLKNLQALSFNANNITYIPWHVLAELPLLESLGLGNNSIGGTLPEELRDLSQLKVLHLGANNLEGSIPAWIGELSQLELLWLYDNQFDGPIPEEIGTLSQLRTLWLYLNQLEGEIPASLGQCTELEQLRLSLNQLSGPIPAELGDLSQLSQLELDRNQLSGPIPASFAQFLDSDLTITNLSDNQLTGCIPEELSVLCGEVFLLIDGNDEMPWKGSWAFFCTGEDQVGAYCDDGNPSTLQDTIQSDCSCAGTLVECDPERDSLALVELYHATNGDDWAENPFPILYSDWLEPGAPVESWYGVTATPEGCVTEIDLSSFNLSGTLPVEVTRLNGLVKLNLSDNRITNEFISDSLEQMVSLSELRLDANELSGPLPATFFNHPQLKTLVLGENQYSGTLPPSGSQSVLETLVVSENDLEGPIPPEWGELSDLKVLWVHSNSLSGEIPASLGNLEITRFFGYRNNFSGCFPESLRNWCASGATVNFSINLLLPWTGDFSTFCEEQQQVGAPCNDGDPMTVMDSIDIDCQCRGTLMTSTRDPGVESFHVYPNPSSDRVHIEWAPQTSRAEIAIYNVLGQQLETRVVTGTHRVEVLLPGAAGVYFVRLSVDGHWVGEKRVVRVR